MTDTTRPEWMPSREGLLSLAHNETLYANCGHDYAGEELEEMVRCAGLRAQIAVLEEISDYYGHTTRDMAVAKIAALRKELNA